MARRSVPYYERLRRLRQDPRVGYAVVFVSVAVSIAARWAIGDLLFAVPFITFYPSVIISALVGGTGPGVAAIMLSALAAWYLFIPAGAFPLVLVLVFLPIAAFNVLLIAVLNRAVDLLWTQRENVRRAVEAAPIGVLAVNTDGAITLLNAATETMFGYSRDELLGKRVELLVPDALRAEHLTLRNAFARAPQTRAMGAGRELFGHRRV
jgi:PAS domain-containing protein